MILARLGRWWNCYTSRPHPHAEPQSGASHTKSSPRSAPRTSKASGLPGKIRVIRGRHGRYDASRASTVAMHEPRHAGKQAEASSGTFLIKSNWLQTSSIGFSNSSYPMEIIRTSFDAAEVQAPLHFPSVTLSSTQSCPRVYSSLCSGSPPLLYTAAPIVIKLLFKATHRGEVLNSG